ncbi:hypothetical protein FPQ18DRAFT_329160, partial [Pyronema domesticum]
MSDNGNGPTIGNPSGAAPQNPNAPPPTPHTIEEALDLMTGPFAVPINHATSTPLRLSRHVAPISTEIVRNLRPDGPKKVARETVVKAAEECAKMVDTARILADAVRDVREERDVLLAHLKAYEQKLKDQAADFENRERNQHLIREAMYGGGDVQEPL